MCASFFLHFFRKHIENSLVACLRHRDVSSRKPGVFPGSRQHPDIRLLFKIRQQPRLSLLTSNSRTNLRQRYVLDPYRNCAPREAPPRQLRQVGTLQSVRLIVFVLMTETFNPLVVDPDARLLVSRKIAREEHLVPPSRLTAS